MSRRPAIITQADVARAIKAARSAVRFARLLGRFKMQDEEGATTVFVTKKGKLLGTVHGQRFIGRSKP